MSVFEIMAKITEYIEKCPTETMKILAAHEFSMAVKEIRQVGYTWGRTHQLPFNDKFVIGLSEKHTNTVLTMLENICTRN